MDRWCSEQTVLAWLAAVVAVALCYGELATRGMDIAVDPLGRVLVLDPYAKAVRIFEPKQEDETSEPGNPTAPADR